jgi:hypothetical protein
MPPDTIVPDDGSLAYAMEYSAGRLVDLHLNPQPGTAPQNAGQAFFALDREAKGELCLALYTVVVRYYRENPPSAELVASWKGLGK